MLICRTCGKLWIYSAKPELYSGRYIWWGNTYMKHIVLLGDSIFDNEAYSGTGRDVSSQLQLLLLDWKVTLLAVDGSTTLDMRPQIRKIPANTTHIVVSMGGNDALGS